MISDVIEWLRGEEMRLVEHGTSTSNVEVLNISSHGIWLYVKGKEHFLPYEDFPWFKNARLSEIYDVQLLHGHLLRWDGLDIDLDLNSLEHPDRMIPKQRKPAHPGEILLEEFLKPMGLSQVELAHRMGVPIQRVNTLVNGKRDITAETAILLSRVLKTSPEFWEHLAHAA